MKEHPLHATIIGGNGFIGRELFRTLTREGWDCWIPARDFDFPCSDRPLGHIFYCAGLTADYLTRPAETIEAHVSLLSRVLQSSTFISLVYLSSTRLYDDRAGLSAGSEGGPFPVAPENPRHLFDLSKLTGEALCAAMGQGKARVARLSCVFCDEHDPDGFIGEVMSKVQRCKKGEVIELDSSASFSRDYIHIDDVVSALRAIALHGSCASYNVASGVNITNLALADLIEKTSGRTLKFLRNTTTTTSPTVDISLIQNQLGWRPTAPAERLLRLLERTEEGNPCRS